ncbi:MAG: DUF4290 domain-containing protein [Bacteroidales bacterium]
MEYNTARETLLFSEYGRGIKKMVDIALTIEDREKRSQIARNIVKTMSILNPQLKDMDNFQQKLYDHLFIISDFKLDIDCPYPIPSPDSIKRSPDKVTYSMQNIRFRYYGKTLEAMIKKACEFEDGEAKTALVNLLAVQMKKSYYLWNDDILTDDLVATHLAILSGGKLIYTEEMKGEVYKHFYQKPSLTSVNKKKFNNSSMGNGIGNNKRAFYKNKKRK